MVIGSNLWPKEEIGIAFNQSDEFVEETARMRALSSLDGADINKFR